MYCTCISSIQNLKLQLCTDFVKSKAKSNPQPRQNSASASPCLLLEPLSPIHFPHTTWHMDLMAIAVHRQRAMLLKFFIDQVLANTRSIALQPGEQVTQLLDILDLLSQVLGFDEVAHLRVVVLAGHPVQLQQSLVHVLLQSKRRLHSLGRRAPFVTLRASHVLELYAATAFVLELHEGLGVLVLLVRALVEELGEALERDVVACEVAGHAEVVVAGVELQVDLLVH